MCGILGSINVEKTIDVLSLIAHRGPDACGHWFVEHDNARVSLFHARLSILDLSSAGHQPMESQNNEHCIVFNGEIYNHLELRNDLDYVEFAGHSDTETLLEYISRFGVNQTLPRLNGIFAFAFLDLQNETLTLARDRFGVKPLYYFFDGRKFVFCSEIKPILKIIDAEIDDESVANCLALRYNQAPFTIYKKIYKVEPGQIVQIQLGSSLTIKKTYFVQTPSKLGFKGGNSKKLVNEYGDLFVRAVERQLLADVEVGVLLSGGIDSALVAAIAKKKSKTSMKAFTVGFESSPHDCDETQSAAETAQQLGLDHYTTIISEQDFIESFRNIASFVEEPVGTTSIVPMYFLSRLAHSHVKVVLSGQGADEPLGGYSKYKALVFLQHRHLFRGAVEILRYASGELLHKETYRRALEAMRGSRAIDSLVSLNSISSSEQIESLLSGTTIQKFDSVENQQMLKIKEIWNQRLPESNNISNLALYYDMRTSLSDDLLMYTDKLTMRHGLECRVPILDNDLVSFLENLKPSFKHNYFAGKIIHKRFAREFLPTSIIERPKQNFNSPTKQWIRNNHSILFDFLNGSSCFTNKFNMHAVRRMFSLHNSGKNFEKQIFLMLTLCCALEKLIPDGQKKSYEYLD